MKHRPKKRFGQNFLQSEAIILAILQAIQPRLDDKLIEIGPGLGALTAPLLQRLTHLHAIEVDYQLYEHLKSLPEAQNKLTLIPADALTVDFSQWGDNIRVVGNLPYNISTPLLFHLLQYAEFIQDMYFMLQKEVVERLAASPGTKDYGRLSIMIQYQCEVTPLVDVPPDAFFPQPKVDSMVVCLKPYRNNPYPAVSLKKLEQLAAQAFSMRRKTIFNNLKKYYSVDLLETLHIDPKLRPEQLTLQDYICLAQHWPK